MVWLYFFHIVKEQTACCPEDRGQMTEDRRCVATRRFYLYSVFCPQSSEMVEVNGIEPMTPCLQSRCSPS